MPFNVQMLAHNCWTRLRDEGRAKVPTLTSTFVDETLKIVVLQQDPFYAQIWVSLTAIQQCTLMAVVAEIGMNLQSAHVAQASRRLQVVDSLQAEKKRRLPSRYGVMIGAKS